MKVFVAQSCPTLCEPMNCSTPGFSVLYYLLEFVQTHVYWVDDAIRSSHPCCPLFLLPSIFPSIRVFSLSQLLTSGEPSIGASASAKFLPMNIYGWFSLGVTGLIFLLSKGLSRVFSSTTVLKIQYSDAQPSSWSNSHIHTWLLEKP